MAAFLNWVCAKELRMKLAYQNKLPQVKRKIDFKVNRVAMLCLGGRLPK